MTSVIENQPGQQWLITFGLGMVPTNQTDGVAYGPGKQTTYL